ncbi:ParB/RepB/Spo0J family partition protein [Donghicola eburneus]|uniref:Chromosome-partitioning protein ParB n=1 Tax=Donghicola eburneus TaxID=393278 RepID=A0A1M4N5S2_9RHOB|nr:ParB/RepB/Spo0J family partition protein [Donghicola eburneus]SCM69387.1 Chromosome-partitioning protein ParB [Donghicola eburneus]SFQ46190.1 chromosome partitioning protein, ParB family [Donghicola eburneus]
MDRKPTKRGLGRGLSALMADVQPETTSDAATTAPRRPDMMVPIEKIEPNPDQPRRRFETEDLEDLSRSIKEKGVIQPLIVRVSPRDSLKYEIVAGERRWRASQMAQLHELPVLIRDFDDTEVLEVAIIENIQRADLNPVDEAAGYKQLMEKFGHTQERLAEALGKSRSYIANSMRLLQLPEDVIEHLADGRLTTGHARALITSDHASELAKQIVSRGMSVRDTERLVKKAAQGETAPKPRAASKSAGEKDADTKALEGDLSAAVGMKVSVEHKDGTEQGKIVISYNSLDQLDEICRRLSAVE